MLVIVIIMTDRDLNHTGKAEDSPCSQRSDRSWRVGGTWRARWPWAPAHWDVSVREKLHDLWCTALSSLSSSLSPSSCRLFAASLSVTVNLALLRGRLPYRSIIILHTSTPQRPFVWVWIHYEFRDIPALYPTHKVTHSSIFQHCCII